MNINNVRNNFTKVLNANKKHKQKESIHNHNRTYAKYYGSKDWHNLRNIYYNEHPLCEACLAAGKVTPGEHVHHLRRFLSGSTEEDKWMLLLNYDNLCTLCVHHHQLIHGIMRTQGRNMVTIPELLQYEQIMNGTF